MRIRHAEVPAHGEWHYISVQVRLDWLTGVVQTFGHLARFAKGLDDTQV